jgi:hypothetical protein
MRRFCHLFSLMGTVALDAAGFHAIDGGLSGLRLESLPSHSQIFKLRISLKNGSKHGSLNSRAVDVSSKFRPMNH